MRDTNLLETRIIPIERKDGSRGLFSLPEVLEALSQDDVESFLDTKAHQSAAVDMFFAHLGVLGIDLGGDGLGIKVSAETWKSRMLRLADIDNWGLYSSDPSVSSFMQPGMGQAEFDRTVANKGKIFSPDEIGVLIVSKNHTVKFSAMANPTAWNWVVSLIEAQTLSGFDGRSLYGIPRMNGGLSTRFRVATYTDLSASGKWNSDVQKILRLLPGIYRNNPHFDEHGKKIGAPWAFFWDGEEQISTRDLHPLYIDVSRRLKLGADDDGRLFVVTSGSSNTRIPHLDLKGVFGDPWAPLVNASYNPKAKKEVAAVYTSLSPSSIPVRLLAKIVTGNEDIVQSPLQQFSKADLGKPAFFCLSAILRGQGETYGYHDFVIPIPAHATFRLAKTEDRDKLGARSRVMIGLALDAESALKYGIFKFCQPEKIEVDFNNGDKAEATFAKASQQFRLAFSSAFFDHLWRAAEAGNDSEWLSFLKDSAQEILETAFQSGGSKAQLSYKAEVQGRSAFEARWHNLFIKEDSK